MDDFKPKTPKKGGEKRIREAYEKQRKRKPSEKLLRILRSEPKEPSKTNTEKKMAISDKKMDLEL